MQKKLKKLIKDKEQKTLLSEILYGYKVLDVKHHRILYRNQNDETIIVKEQNGGLLFEKGTSAIDSIEHTFITFLPSNQVVIKSYERRQQGLIFSTTEINYINTPNGLKEKKISNTRYVYTNETLNKILNTNTNHNEIWIIINMLKQLQNKIFIEAECDLCNGIEAEVLPNETISVRFNNVDKTRIFEGVKNDNRLLRILNLYNGTVTESILPDLYNIHDCQLDERAFAFRELKGVDEQEDSLVGARIIPKPQSYYDILDKFFIKHLHIKCPDLDTRHTVIKYLVFQPDMHQITRRKLEISLDMPYSEFEKLDLREQEKIIRRKNTFHLLLKPNIGDKYLYKIEDKK